MTLVLDNLDDDLAQRLQEAARQNGSDVSTLVLKLLKQHYPTPIRYDDRGPVYRDLRDLAGTWTEEEFQEFERNTAQFRQIDEELWR